MTGLNIDENFSPEHLIFPPLPCLQSMDCFKPAFGLSAVLTLTGSTMGMLLPVV